VGDGALTRTRGPGAGGDAEVRQRECWMLRGPCARASAPCFCCTLLLFFVPKDNRIWAPAQTPDAAGELRALLSYAHTLNFLGQLSAHPEVLAERCRRQDAVQKAHTFSKPLPVPHKRGSCHPRSLRCVRVCVRVCTRTMRMCVCHFHAHRGVQQQHPNGSARAHRARESMAHVHRRSLQSKPVVSNHSLPKP
jgi:hypothetical protein